MRLALPAAALLAVVLVLACSRDESRARVAARVNGEDISIDRLRQALAQASAAQDRPAGPALLMEREIDRQLLAQKARRLHLDRDRVVSAAIEAATTGILAQAYLERSLELASDELRERAKYYREHPALFAERRTFSLFELSAIAPPARLPEIERRAARARGLQEIAAWLKSQGIAYEARGATRASEEIDAELIGRLQAMRDGQIAVVRTPEGATVVQLLRSQIAPLSEEDAAATIEARLRAERRERVAERELRQLRASAKIEYFVDFKGPSAANRSDR
ncbi:MAG TPA: EpsD family peptidyl-prolyl cis-trans isomerase [Burkholderiales bacterium]|jgi:EpsD family peptidyl-prolyl cis-trans isomerase|nr:EpsD family peptidyl-prolyl cis-trans isomerase [Burkholderiales bacterium]